MNLWHAVILGAVQGLTEFIPISSTAHLYLVQQLLHVGNGAEALSFDIVLHLGTAVALAVVFWRELLAMLVEAMLWATRRPARSRVDRALLLPLIVGTVPGVAAGLFLLRWFEGIRSSLTIGLSMLVACTFFLVSEALAVRWNAHRKERSEPTVRDALWIGVAQGVAGLLAGFSRSGFTISAGRLVGLTRAAAARTSFLLAFVIICGAGAKTLLDLWKTPDFSIETTPLIVGFVTSTVTGFLAVRFLLKFLRTNSLRVFAAYLGVLGTVLVILALAGRPI